MRRRLRENGWADEGCSSTSNVAQWLHDMQQPGSMAVFRDPCSLSACESEIYVRSPLRIRKSLDKGVQHTHILMGKYGVREGL